MAYVHRPDGGTHARKSRLSGGFGARPAVSAGRPANLPVGDDLRARRASAGSHRGTDSKVGSPAAEWHHHKIAGLTWDRDGAHSPHIGAEWQAQSNRRFADHGKEWWRSMRQEWSGWCLGTKVWVVCMFVAPLIQMVIYLKGIL